MFTYNIKRVYNTSSFCWCMQGCCKHLTHIIFIRSPADRIQSM